MTNRPPHDESSKPPGGGHHHSLEGLVNYLGGKLDAMANAQAESNRIQRQTLKELQEVKTTQKMNYRSYTKRMGRAEFCICLLIVCTTILIIKNPEALAATKETAAFVRDIVK
ncbi:MAG: hypothetical protein AB7H77_11975 [Bdellovibrionales bacterium]